uniref:Uncharacterized protein n=1 Tax=Strongyloides papillosus TaxID=174720 RepID=A0A0N5C0L3_STREA
MLEVPSVSSLKESYSRNTTNIERLEIRCICTGSAGDRIYKNLDLSSMATLKRVFSKVSIELLLKTTETTDDFRSIIIAIFRNSQTTRSLYSFEFPETNIMTEAQKICHISLTNWINVFAFVAKDPDYYYHEDEDRIHK